MKLVHLSDLHLGKRLNEVSLIEDQKYILKEITDIIKEEAPQGVILAGDIYDRMVPSSEAVTLLDDFLVELSRLGVKVFAISGNHDSAERLAFGGRLMEAQGVYMAPIYSGSVAPITLSDDYGEFNIYLLPFIKPATVRRFFPDDEIKTYSDAVAFAIGQMNVDTSKRNIIVTHQFIVGASLSDSEELNVGGTDAVSGELFGDFDYVALGHIHNPQNVSSERIRYCGTPLKYSFSEASHTKSVTVLEFSEKGTFHIKTRELTPLHEMVELRGKCVDLCSRELSEPYEEDYVHITLTDEEVVPDAANKLRVFYHNLMKLDYDNRRTQMNRELQALEVSDKRSELEMFADFYFQRNNQTLSQEQSEYLSQMIDELKEVEV